MKYFLAYENRDGRLVKIERKGVVPSSSDFKDILDFTLSFENLYDFEKFLNENNLIPAKFYSIYYISQAKQSDESTIKKITYPELKFKPDRKFYDPISLKELLCRNISSIDFIDYMISKYLKKLGMKKYVSEDILNRLNHAYDFGVLVNELRDFKTCFDDSQIKNAIDEFISKLESASIKGDLVYDNIEYLAEIILLNESETFNYYSLSRDRLIRTKKVVEPPVILELFKIRAKYYYKKSTKEFFEPVSFDENVDNLLKLIICKYGDLKDDSGNPVIRNGRKQKGFIIKNGVYVIKARELYDLGSYLKKYEMSKTYYEHSEEVRNDIELAIDENKNETEEFLTEDDYRLDLKCNGDVYWWFYNLYKKC